MGRRAQRAQRSAPSMPSPRRQPKRAHVSCRYNGTTGRPLLLKIPVAMQTVLFAGCEPEVAAGIDGRILAVGKGARAAAGRRAEVVRLRGRAWPGLIDAHIHLEGLADRYLTLDLEGAPTLEETLARIRSWSAKLADDAWVVGSGWYNDLWGLHSFPTRRQLDAAGGRRPAFQYSQDGHSPGVSSAALM